MLEHVANNLNRHCQVDFNSTVLIGVSGGPDSLFLLHVLQRLGLPVVAAHLNHRLRVEADEEARSVEAFTQRLNIPFVSSSEDAGAYAADKNLSIEEAARIIRYRFLFREAEKVQAQAVAVAHTADDQVETVLMHFLRGAGLDGLQGMSYRSLPNPWSETIPLVRPLLDIWREEIDAYHREHDLHPSQDSSNLDTRIYRNRLRHELIPYLKQYNPNVRQVIWRTADVLRADNAALEMMVDGVWQSCLISETSNYLTLDRELLLQQPVAVQRRILRRAIGVLRPGLRDIGFETIERALAFLQSPSRSGQRDLVAGLRLRTSGNRLWVAEWDALLPETAVSSFLDACDTWPQLPSDSEYPLPVPGSINLEGNWKLEALSVEEPDFMHDRAAENDDPLQAWVDADELVLPLVVRPRRPGDRFAPLGMQGHQTKVADFFINVKLPEALRRRWPLVCSGGRIVWIPGFRLGHPFRVREGTRRVVHLRLVSGKSI
jgi:tRNA(Ile)-lysidine synthase